MIPKNAGFCYIFGGDGFVKYGMTKTATEKDLRKRQKEHENGLSQLTVEKVKLELLAAVISINPSVSEKSILSYFADDILRGNKIYRLPMLGLKNAASEFRRKSDVSDAWINELLKKPFVASSYEDLLRIFELPVPGYEDWGPEFIYSKSYPNRKGSLPFIEDAENWERVRPIDEDDSDGDYYTQSLITDLAREVMGTIDLDPSSCNRANKGDLKEGECGVRATTFFDKNDDGLQQEWFGRVWLNPPFGCWDQWLPKVMLEISSKRVSEIFVLAPISSITGGEGFFDTNFVYIASLFIPRGRFKFWGSKDFTGAPGQGSVLYYYGPNIDKFKEKFSKYGVVYDPPGAQIKATKTLATNRNKRKKE